MLLAWSSPRPRGRGQWLLVVIAALALSVPAASAPRPSTAPGARSSPANSPAQSPDVEPALLRPYAQGVLGGAAFPRVLPQNRAFLAWGLRAGTDVGGALGAELGILVADESLGPSAARVETSWRLLDLRATIRLRLPASLDAGLAAGPLLDLGTTTLTVSDPDPAQSSFLHLAPGASASAFLRWRLGHAEARLDGGAWAFGGRVVPWVALAAGAAF